MSTAVALPRPAAGSDRLRFVGRHFLDSAAGVAVVLSALMAIRLFNRKEK